jgi:membrane protein insertase Oxa1/YidC/SpoIIIJ
MKQYLEYAAAILIYIAFVSSAWYLMKYFFPSTPQAEQYKLIKSAENLLTQDSLRYTQDGKLVHAYINDYLVDNKPIDALAHAEIGVELFDAKEQVVWQHDNNKSSMRYSKNNVTYIKEYRSIGQNQYAIILTIINDNTHPVTLIPKIHFNHELSSKNATFTNSIGSSWCALSEKYHTIVVASKDSACKIDKESLLIESKQPIKLAPKETRTCEYTLYIGPKNLKKLHSFAKKHNLHNIDKTFGYGIWFILLKPFFWLLELLCAFLSPILALFLLSFVTRLLCWPLKARSMIYMAKRQNLQPEFDKLKEQYAADPLKHLSARRELMKNNGLQFGMLTTIIQQIFYIFILITLNNSFCMHNAKFLLWDNLAEVDTFIIFRLLGISIGILPLCASLMLTFANQQQPMSVYAKFFTVFIMSWLLTKFLTVAGLIHFCIGAVVDGVQMLINKRYNP